MIYSEKFVQNVLQLTPKTRKQLQNMDYFPKTYKCLHVSVVDQICAHVYASCAESREDTVALMQSCQELADKYAHPVRYSQDGCGGYIFMPREY